MTKTKILNTLKKSRFSENELNFDILTFAFIDFEKLQTIIKHKLELCDYLHNNINNFVDKKSIFIFKQVLGLQVEIIKNLLNSNFLNEKDSLIKKWKKQFNFYYGK